MAALTDKWEPEQRTREMRHDGSAVAPEGRQAISFGIGGTDANYLAAGWSGDEPGFRWTIGPKSDLWLENPYQAGDFRLELDLSPFSHAPDLPRQRLTVSVRGVVVGRCSVTTRRVWAFRIPEELLAGPGPVRVQLDHPDARAPTEFGGTDGRVLALCCHGLALLPCRDGDQEADFEAGQGLTIDAVARETGVAAADYLFGFESLGDNCEFGLMQRRCGAEPMGLLRFAKIALPDLLRGLETRFDQLGDPKKVVVQPPRGRRREYTIRDKAYGIVYHTWQREGMVEPHALLTEQISRLQFLRRKLIEDLTEARKVFIWRHTDDTSEAQVRALHAALRRFGPNTLLWVTEAGLAGTPGAVEQIAPGLFQGITDRLAPYRDANEYTLDLWLLLCVKVDKMRHAHG
jgi:hypothetical protein